MKGFIVNQLFNYPGQTANGYTIQVSAPVNTNKAKINGAEAQIRTFFDFAGCAELASFVRHRSQRDLRECKSDTRTGSGHPTAPNRRFPNAIYRLPIPDVSPWTFNVVGMYERGPLSVRLGLQFPHALSGRTDRS